MCFLHGFAKPGFLFLAIALLADQQLLAQPVAIGSRLEMFVDDHLVERLSGETRLELHHPVPQEVALVHDAPWEGTGSGYHSVFQDGDIYRMYYKAWHLDVQQGKVNTDAHPLYCCYAESDDGIAWRKPNLGLIEFEGSKENNIVIASGKATGPGGGLLNIDAGHPAIFKDENPTTADDARYKSIVRSSSPNGLLPMKSPDGIHWSPMSDEPLLSGLGVFDSQNLAFWDPTISKYRAYWRIFTPGIVTDSVPKPPRYRAIRTATSDDLIHWSKHVDLTYADSPPEQLYTNQIKPYHRAPHLLIGFPARYIDRGWSGSMKALPELKHRRLRASSTERYGTAITEGLLMSSRDGVHFNRWNEAFLPPGPERPGTWNYGHQYIAWHVVETESSLKGAPRELSLYATESYWTGKGSALRRYTLRMDGFVSATAPMSGGELLTKPLVFDGDELAINFSTSAAGSVQVEIQEMDGKPVEGFALADCPPIFGDSIDRIVSWKNGADVRKLAGRPVRLRWVLRDADLYAFQFRENTPPEAGHPEKPSEKPHAALTLSPGPGNPRNSEGDFIRLKDGRTMFIYTKFSGGTSDHASASLMARYSNDEGKTWTNNDIEVVSNEGGWNVMSVSLLRLQGGEIALFYLRKNSLSDCRPLMRISSDEGKTWSEPTVCIADDDIGYFVMNNDRAVQLQSGRLILPVALHGRPGDKKLDMQGQIMCYLSDDVGKTWRRSETVMTAVDESGNRLTAQEPGIVELTDNRLMMFVRSNVGSQLLSFSEDAGVTWSAMKPSNIISPVSPATIERIPKTGDLLMVWNNHENVDPIYKGKRTPLNIALSHDEGKTWHNVKTLSDDPNGWYCYTAVEFVGDFVLLGHCAGDSRDNNGLNRSKITRFRLDWLYE